MIAAVVFAALLGVIATYALTGRGRGEDGLARSFVLGLPMVAVAGAGFAGITLPWAVGMAVAVAVGLVLAPLLPAPRGPFAAAVRMTVGIVMAAAMLRWLVEIAANLTGLNAWFLALAVIAAGAAWAAGGRGTLTRTAFVLSIVTAVLLLAAGIALGAPGTLTSPLVPIEQNTVSGVLWLLAVLVFALMHPAPGRGPAGGILVGLALLLGLIGLLSLLGGMLTFPSTGLATIAGYASSNGGVAGTVLGVPVIIVAVVAVAAAMRASLDTWSGFTPPGRIASPAWQITIVAALVGLCTFAPIPVSTLVGVSALAAVLALILDRRSEDDPAEQPVAADA